MVFLLDRRPERSEGRDGSGVSNPVCVCVPASPGVAGSCRGHVQAWTQRPAVQEHARDESLPGSLTAEWACREQPPGMWDRCLGSGQAPPNTRGRGAGGDTAGAVQILPPPCASSLRGAHARPAVTPTSLGLACRLRRTCKPRGVHARADPARGSSRRGPLPQRPTEPDT